MKARAAVRVRSRGRPAMLLLVSMTSTVAKASSSSITFSTFSTCPKSANAPPRLKSSKPKPETIFPLASSTLA